MGSTIHPIAEGVVIEVAREPRRYTLFLADGSEDGVEFDLTPLLIKQEEKSDETE